MKKLNSSDDVIGADEDRSQIATIERSEKGTNMMQSERQLTTANRETMEKVKSRLWRISHSLSTVRNFQLAVKKFEKYLIVRGLTYGDALESPLKTLDNFAAWLDEHNASATTRTYISLVKKLLLADGAVIDHYRFREEVVLPKIKPLQDDKVNQEQIRRILLGLKNEKLKCLVMLMKDTCARPSEILGLRLSEFNLANDPPYLSIPAHLAKNDIPREAFFTQETKSVLMTYMQNRGVKNPSDFVFLNKQVDIHDEMEFQRILRTQVSRMTNEFRGILRKPGFKDLNEAIDKRGVDRRYRIHLYSVKKFAFTAMADALGELAARAIKGDKEYVLTYYKKSREERAEDYRKILPKLSIFGADEKSKLREQVEATIRKMKDKDMERLLEFIQNGKSLFRE